MTFDPKRNCRAFKLSDPRTWGFGRKKPTMGFDDTVGSTHELMFSGGLKTTGAVTPMLLSWPGSMQVFDPSPERHLARRETQEFKA